MRSLFTISIFFFFNDTATTEIYTLSLHDALPICVSKRYGDVHALVDVHLRVERGEVVCLLGPNGAGKTTLVSTIVGLRDRKSTRLNSSHGYISYAVFCLKKKKKRRQRPSTTTDAP